MLCSFHTVESCIGYQPDSNRKVSPKKRCANFGHEQSPSVPGEFHKSTFKVDKIIPNDSVGDLRGEHI